MTPSLDDARLAVVVHEIRSPVAALAAVSEAAAAGGARGSEARGELFRLAIAAAGAIERIVVDAAVVSVRPEPMDLRLLVLDVVAAHSGGADVVSELDEELPVLGDPIRLRQALDNLVVNALAYGGPGRVTVRATAAASGPTQITVSDSGPGIPASLRDEVFEAGTRLDSDTYGSGLGLALARAIAEAHGGSLELGSARDGGATFTLTLPSPPDHPDTAASSS